MRTQTILSALSLILLIGCPTLPEPEPVDEDCPTETCRGTIALDINGLLEDDLTAGGAIHLTLLGFDVSIADVGSTIIDSSVYELSDTVLPVRLGYSFPDDADDLIEWSNGDPEQHRFWFHVWVDLDGDGQLCEGELVEAGEPAGPVAFGTDPHVLELGEFSGDCHVPGV